MRTSDLNRKNISVHLSTYERLGSYGGINDSYSDVIDNIIDWSESMGLGPETLRRYVKERRESHPKHNV